VLMSTSPVLPLVANACPSCYGDPDSPMTHGMTMAILSLLGITATVLGGLVLFFLYLRHRTRAINRRFQNMLN
jgi:hypothetical protein